MVAYWDYILGIFWLFGQNLCTVAYKRNRVKHIILLKHNKQGKRGTNIPRKKEKDTKKIRPLANKTTSKQDHWQTSLKSRKSRK